MHTNFYVYIYVQEVGGESVEQMMGRLHGQTHNKYVTTYTFILFVYNMYLQKVHTANLLYCTPY